MTPEKVAGPFLAAFSTADVEAMRSLLADDLVAYVSDADGAMIRVEGREAYLERVAVMVEIRAQRAGRSLHNFAAHLLRVRDGRIAEWRMVDAKPAESAAFWS